MDAKILKPAPLAYENEQFLKSPDGRVLRILSEYIEPLARFRREQIQDTRSAGQSCPGGSRPTGR